MGARKAISLLLTVLTSLVLATNASAPVHLPPAKLAILNKAAAAGGGGDTIAFRSASHDMGTATDITMTEPSGAAENDIFLAIAFCHPSGTLGAPSGWTVLNSGTDAFDSAFDYNVAWIRRGASAPSLTWTTGSSVLREVRIVCVSGAKTTGSPVEASTTAQGSSSDPNPASVTTVNANALVVPLFVYAFNNNSGSDTGGWTPPSGYTFAGPNPDFNRCGGAYKLVASAGAEDPGAFLNRSGSLNWWAVSVALSD